MTIASLSGGSTARPPYGPKFSQFHVVFQKIWQNHMLVPPPPPRGLAPPPTGNPGSAPVTNIITRVVTAVILTLGLNWPLGSP